MIEAKKLTRKYGDFTAVDRLSFTVDSGTVLGFLGPNGAGKSTTMKMLTGFLPPTSGTAAIHGHDVTEDSLAARRLVGYLPEGAPLYGELTVQRFMEFVAGARGYRGAEAGRRVGAAIERLQLAEVRRQTIETLSKGFKRRVGLAQAILSDPPVLVLDEPTDGLDPNQKQQVRKLIREMSEDKIIIISTHILEEVDALCSRAMIIARGRLLADEPPASLLARSRYARAVSLACEDLEAAAS
ncbi:MAG: ABC transporter ATP-binding protein, partial [Wenzhouxiangellaceae bacterium]